MSELESSMQSGFISSLTNLAGLPFNALSSWLGGKLNNKLYGSQRQRMQWQAEVQKDMMSHQAQLNRDQYDYEFSKESAYNDPSAVVKRLLNAGLNPALFYSGGSGASGQGVSASLGSSSLLGPQQGSILESAIPYVDPLTSSNISVNKAQEQKLLAEAEAIRGREGRDVEKHSYEVDKLKNEVKSGQLKNALDEIAKDIAESTKEDKIQMSHEELNKLRADIRLVEETTDLTIEQKEKVIQETALLEVTKRLQESQIALNYQSVRKLISDIEVNEQHIQESISRINLNNANMLKAFSDVNVNDSLADFNDARRLYFDSLTEHMPKDKRAERFDRYVSSISRLINALVNVYKAVKNSESDDDDKALAEALGPEIIEFLSTTTL